MKFFIIFYISIIVDLTMGNSNQRINDGASTSTASDDQRRPRIDRSEACEINNYIDNAINLVLEELYSSNNRYIDETIFQETESSVYIRQISDRLRYGSNYAEGQETVQLLTNYGQRREYFTSTAMSMVLDRITDIVEYNATQCFPDDHYDSTIFDQNSFLQRLSMGDIYILMHAILSKLELTPTEISQEESNIFHDTNNIDENFRFKRSLNNQEKKCYPIEHLTRQHWSNFIVYVTSTLIKLHSVGESTAWLCDFMFLYNEYKTHLSANNDNCFRLNFASYLYLRVSRIPDWNNCINFNKQNNINGWCEAWRRLLLNSNGDFLSNIEKNKNSEMLNQDLKIMINWMWKKVFNVKKKISDQNFYTSEIVQTSVCYRDISTLSCPNNCDTLKYRVTSSRISRALSSSDNVSYVRKWLKDTDNKLRCRCAEDNITSHVTPFNTTSESSNWFIKLFESKWQTKCGKGSPDRGTPRCDEFRRK